MKNYRFKIALLFILIPLTFNLSFAQVPSIGGIQKPSVSVSGGVGELCDATYTGKSYTHSQGQWAAVIFLNQSGTQMFIVDKAYGRTYIYNLATAWDVSTASYYGLGAEWDVENSNASNPYAMDIKEDGTKVFIPPYTKDYLILFDVSTPWELSSSSVSSYQVINRTTYSSTATMVGGDIGSNGTSVIFAALNSLVYNIDLTSAWDLSTAPASITSSHNYGLTSFNQAFYSHDGNRLYLLSNGDLDYSELYTPFSLSSVGSLVGCIDVNIDSDDKIIESWFIEWELGLAYGLERTTYTVFQYEF